MRVPSVIEIFFSYAHEDEDLMNDVRRQLVVYERKGRIIKWHDRQIPAGDQWRNQIDSRLQSAQIILLFASKYFIESDYCYEIEGETALQRHNDGSARVIPVILRPCAWNETPFGELQALPRDAKPITQWRDREQACLDVARGVQAVVEELTSAQTPMKTKKSAARPTPRTRTKATARKKASARRTTAKKRPRRS